LKIGSRFYRSEKDRTAPVADISLRPIDRAFVLAKKKIMLVVQSHWGLHEIPFSDQPESHAFYRAESQTEALARMHYVVEHGRQARVVRGDGGIGNSLVSRVHSREVGGRGFAAGWLNIRGATDASIRDQLATELSLPWSEEPTWERLGQRCFELILERGKLVLTLDDADGAAPEVLERLRALFDQQASRGGRLSAILTSRAPSGGRLQGQFAELADLRVDLEPWSIEETTGFLNASMVRAGGAAFVFDGAAIRQIHDRAQGNPRDIFQIARLTLFAGANDHASEIDSRTVDSVARQLSGAFA